MQHQVPPCPRGHARCCGCAARRGLTIRRAHWTPSCCAVPKQCWCQLQHEHGQQAERIVRKQQTRVRMRLARVGVCGRAVSCSLFSGRAIGLCSTGAMLPIESQLCCPVRWLCTAVSCGRCFSRTLLLQTVVHADPPLHVGVICFVVKLGLCSRNTGRTSDSPLQGQQ
jgi:hypothetical protein